MNYDSCHSFVSPIVEVKEQEGEEKPHAAQIRISARTGTAEGREELAHTSLCT